jgi:sec-independent protein translocase protein TatB
VLDLSPEKIFVLAILALVVLGPHRLPQAARTLGRLMGQLRALTSNVQDEMREALHEPHEAFNTALNDFRPSEIRRNVRQSVMDTIAPPAPAAGPAPSAATPGYTPDGPAAGSPVPGGHPDDPSLN